MTYQIILQLRLYINYAHLVHNLHPIHGEPAIEIHHKMQHGATGTDICRLTLPEIHPCMGEQIKMKKWIQEINIYYEIILQL